MWLKQVVTAVLTCVADCCGSVLIVILTTVSGAYSQCLSLMSRKVGGWYRKQCGSGSSKVL